MKICFLTENIFSLGGVQRVISVLANSLSEKHDVDIICTTNQNIDRSLYNLNQEIKVKHLTIPKNNIIIKGLRKLNLWFGILDNKQCKKILKKVYCPSDVKNVLIKNLSSYDVVIASESYLTLLVALISENLEGKIIGWQHSIFQSYFKTPMKHFYNVKELVKEFLPKLDSYIVLNHEDKINLKKEFNVESKLIHNPISFNSELKSTLNIKRIIAAGRLVEMKGFHLLIEAFKEVILNDNTWRLDIFGEGPERERLEAIIRDNNLCGYIHLCGKTNNIFTEMINSSLFVLPSKWEGFGMVIIEAMECGIPVIAFSSPGTKEIIKNNVNGLLVENGNVDELSKAIIKLINNKNILKKMSEESLLRAKDFSINQIIRDWEDILY